MCGAVIIRTKLKNVKCDKRPKAYCGESSTSYGKNVKCDKRWKAYCGEIECDKRLKAYCGEIKNVTKDQNYTVVRADTKKKYVTKDEKHTVARAEGRGCRNSRHGPTFQNWDLKHFYQNITSKLLDFDIFVHICEWRSYMRGSWVWHILMRRIHNMVRILNAIYIIMIMSEKFIKLSIVFIAKMANSNSTWQKGKCWWWWQERWIWRWRWGEVHGASTLGKRQFSLIIFSNALWSTLLVQVLLFTFWLKEDIIGFQRHDWLTVPELHPFFFFLFFFGP